MKATSCQTASTGNSRTPQSARSGRRKVCQPEGVPPSFYGIEAYRYYRQRRTTVMARVSVSFVNETLWPEFNELNRALNEHLTGVTDRVIQSLYDGDVEAEVRRGEYLGA